MTAGIVLLSPYYELCLLAPFKHKDCAFLCAGGAAIHCCIY